MATATQVTDCLLPLRRTNSSEFLPPHMSGLRVVLLGNSWSERSSVGNFILRETKFNTEEEPDCCIRVTGQLKEKDIVLINTPDLLHPNISEHKLTEHVENCASLSDPGPHVFLLVLQPKDFTEDQKLRLCRILQLFSSESFDHSQVLISTPRDKSSGLQYIHKHRGPLQDLLIRFRQKPLRMKKLEFSKLLRSLNQIVERNNGKHVSCDHPSIKDKSAALVTSDSTGSIGCGLRIVLFGKSQQKKTTLGNFVMKKNAFHFSRFLLPKQCEVADREWRGKSLTVALTPDMFSLSVEAVREEMKNCVTLCSPGPNVLLLLVKPSDFTEENRKTLKFILSLFDQDAFKYSMVVITHEENETSCSVSQILKDCGGQKYSIVENNHKMLMEKIENIVHENKETFLTFTEVTARSQYKAVKPALNL
uniref:AIG1-type G domain-containing protein n=1 Tax=Anabas testudineus TaxID=64144 RepID=A0A7N6FKP6_ANATE